MKKFYSLLMILALSTLMSYGQSVVVFGAPTDANVLKIADSVEAAWSGITITVADPATIVDMVQADWDAYDAAVLTESGGSASHGNFGILGAHSVPFVCLKAYAIKKNLPQWHWITADADQWFQSAKDSSIADYEKVYSGVVEELHPIFGGFYEVGDEFPFTTAYNVDQGDEAHIQTFDLKMSHDAVKNASTLIATNKYAKDETTSTVDGWLWAVEENDSSKAGVVWGIHHQYMDNATNEFFMLLQNSLAWVLGHEIPNVYVEPPPPPEGLSNQKMSDFNLNCIPNPVREIAKIQFNLEKPADVYLIVRDVVGKTVYELNDSYNQGAQQIQLDVSGLASGIYNYRIIVDGRSQSKLMVVR
jgi:hypothetical protein